MKPKSNSIKYISVSSPENNRNFPFHITRQIIHFQISDPPKAVTDSTPQLVKMFLKKIVWFDLNAITMAIYIILQIGVGDLYTDFFFSNTNRVKHNLSNNISVLLVRKHAARDKITCFHSF